jgi:large subunit ribosomal protein L21
MRFAIVESGGKQYRAVEGRTIEVDRLPVDTGNKFDFERVLLMADGDDIMVGTPTVSDILVKVTVVDHVKGPKIDRFKYRPKKRIRVRGGHRQQYTRLMIDFIGRPDEERKVETAEAAPVVVEETAEVEETSKEKLALSKAEGKQAKASTRKAAKPAATKSSSKKTDTKKK